MGTLYEFSGTSRPPGSTAPHPAVVAFPLVPCNAGPTPDWSLSRLSEDRFRLTLAAAGLAEDDIAVRVQGGLLHIDGCRRGDGECATEMRCMFLLLEPLQLVDYRIFGGRLFIDLQRDHATPCRADIPPRLRDTAALALAA